jgi:hypothetical protein
VERGARIGNSGAGSQKSESRSVERGVRIGNSGARSQKSESRSVERGARKVEGEKNMNLFTIHYSLFTKNPDPELKTKN